VAVAVNVIVLAMGTGAGTGAVSVTVVYRTVWACKLSARAWRVRCVPGVVLRSLFLVPSVDPRQRSLQLLPRGAALQRLCGCAATLQDDTAPHQAVRYTPDFILRPPPSLSLAPLGPYVISTFSQPLFLS